MTATTLPVIVADIRKNDSERLRITIDEFHGVPIIDVRQWYFSRDDSEPRPTKKGLSVAIRHLPALAKAMTDALDRAREMGLID
jgi:hypothetical protein